MDLSNATTEQLLQALNAKGVHGVVAVHDREAGRLEAWWGDRSKCLGFLSRLTYSVNLEMDDFEEDEEDECCEDEAEEGLDELRKEFPQLGMYL